MCESTALVIHSYTGEPVPDPIKAKPVDPYATQIPGRNKPFKTHRTLGQAKAALSLYLARDRAPRGSIYQRTDDGVYVAHMVLYRLDPERGEYEPWIEIGKGDRRSLHPELMPERGRPTHEPTDEQERAAAIAAVRALRWECACPETPHKPWCLAEAKTTLLTRLGADQ